MGFYWKTAITPTSTCQRLFGTKEKSFSFDDPSRSVSHAAVCREARRDNSSTLLRFHHIPSPRFNYIACFPLKDRSEQEAQEFCLKNSDQFRIAKAQNGYVDLPG